MTGYRRDDRTNLRRTGTLWCCGLLMLAGAAGCKEPPPEPQVPTVPRSDFRPEEFGIGRPHTKNAACNREIDRLLDEVRRCFNERPGENCERLQQLQSQHIGRLKNRARCQH